MTRLEILLDCIAKGMTQAETARLLGVDPSAVYKAARRHRLRFASDRERRSRAKLEREVREARERQARREARQEEIEAAKAAKASAALLPPEPEPMPPTVRIILDHLAAKGRISERTVLRMDEAVLGAAMARVAPAVGVAA